MVPLLFLGTIMLSMACADSGSQPATPTASTSIPKVDLVVSSLLDKDIDALVDLVQFTPQGCSPRSEAGSPVIADGIPTCEPGKPAGSPVPMFVTVGCNPDSLTTSEEVEEAFEAALSLNSRWSLYAVVKGQLLYPPSAGYGVAVTEGSVTSPSGPGLLFHTSEEGEIDMLDVGCGVPGIARMIDQAMPGAEYLIGPFQGRCSPGPGEMADVFVRVQKYNGESFTGLVEMASRQPTGETVRVHIDSTTQFNGQAQGDILEEYPGFAGRVQVIGQRQEDCSIVAINILTLETPAQDR